MNADSLCQRFILPARESYFVDLLPESFAAAVKTHSLCDFEPYPLLYISLSREGCPQPKFSSIDKSEPLAAGLWVPGMKVHRVPAVEKKVRMTYSHVRKRQKPFPQDCWILVD